MKWHIRGRGRNGSWGTYGALLLGVSGLACAEEETGFVIIGNIRTESPECLARADGAATLLLDGLLDVALSPEYEGTLLVGNLLTPRGDKPNLRTETMIANITGAEVHLYTDTGDPDPDSPEFTVPASGVIRPESSGDPGFGVLTATIIPAATGIRLAGELSSPAEVRTRVAVIRVFGKTVGGIDIESAPFNYVIRVCEGCSIEFPADAISTTDGSCFGAVTDDQQLPCRFGQDQSIDCRLCSGSNRFCTFPGGIDP